MTSARSGRPRALIVDDNHQMADIMSLMLEAIGLESLYASNAKEALSHIRQENIGVVITDVRMPEMNGVKLLTTLKDEQPALPVLVMTAYTLSEEEEEKVNRLSDGFLKKPFRMDELRGVLKRFINP